jgi:hypothetical protein
MDPRVVDDFRNMFLLGETNKQLEKLIHTVEDDKSFINNTVSVTQVENEDHELIEMTSIETK